MVATTKGPVNAPGGKDSKPSDRTDSDDTSAKRTLELDEATWGQVQAQAQSQQTTPADVVRRTIENAYGRISPEGAWHSGLEDDPARGARIAAISEQQENAGSKKKS